MATDSENVGKIRQYDRDGLVELWEAILEKDCPGWDPGKAFEYLVLRAFELEGAVITWPFPVQWPSSEDVIEQIDGAVYVDGLSCLIESKDSKAQSVEPIAKMRNQLLRRPAATVGLLFSTGGFTEPAQLAACFLTPQSVLLWDGNDVDFCLRESSFRQGLVKKYRHAVEQGLPDYSVAERKVQ